MMSRMADARDGAASSKRSTATIPAMPHMPASFASGSRSRRDAGFRRARRVDELPEPQLEHHEVPQPMPVIATAVAMLTPDTRDRPMIEDAAIAEPAIEEECINHGCQWTFQPRTGRRFEAVLWPVDDGFRHAPFEQ